MKKSFTQEDIDRNMKRLGDCFPHLTKFPYKAVSVKHNIDKDRIRDIAKLYDKLAYPQHPNWTYCIPLFPNIEINGKTVDIGFHFNEDWIKNGEHSMSFCISNNIVYSNEPCDYGSGDLGISNKFGKKLTIGLHNLEIVSREELGHMILDFNGFMSKFLKSDLVGFDLQDFIESKLNQNK